MYSAVEDIVTTASTITASTRTDVASTVPELLSVLWDMVLAQKEKGEFSVAFPNMEDKLNSKTFMARLTAHLDTCKDVCEEFGITKMMIPYATDGKIRGFTIKCLTDGNPMSNEYEFEYDPLWDDFEEIVLPPDEDDEDYGEVSAPHHVPDSDDEIVTVSKRWVSKMMSDLGVCPFTVKDDKAGLPLGKVFYTTDRATTVEEIYARYWKEVVRVERADEIELSTTLLVTPEFAINNVELFENFGNTLTQPLEPLGLESLLQLVFFHPDWAFRDGAARMGSGNAANFARRSPWPMINILRTKQVRAAQRGIPTGLVYQQNEKTLGKIGEKNLEKMLRTRNWEDVGNMKVNRRDFEAIRIAQDLQDGKIDEKDISMQHDSLPAANKIKKGETEEGDMVNVIKQALEKRLRGETLNGAETSVCLMATDFVVGELDRMCEQT